MAYADGAVWGCSPPPHAAESNCARHIKEDDDEARAITKSKNCSSSRHRPRDRTGRYGTGAVEHRSQTGHRGQLRLRRLRSRLSRARHGPDPPPHDEPGRHSIPWHYHKGVSFVMLEHGSLTEQHLV